MSSGPTTRDEPAGWFSSDTHSALTNAVKNLDQVVMGRITASAKYNPVRRLVQSVKELAGAMMAGIDTAAQINNLDTLVNAYLEPDSVVWAWSTFALNPVYQNLVTFCNVLTDDLRRQLDAGQEPGWRSAGDEDIAATADDMRALLELVDPDRDRMRLLDESIKERNGFTPGSYNAWKMYKNTGRSMYLQRAIALSV